MRVVLKKKWIFLDYLVNENVINVREAAERDLMLREG